MSKNNKSFRIVFSFDPCTSVKAVALASMFESLEKAIQQREKLLQTDQGHGLAIKAYGHRVIRRSKSMVYDLSRLLFPGRDIASVVSGQDKGLIDDYYCRYVCRAQSFDAGI